jgi:hypothetical protein
MTTAPASIDELHNQSVTKYDNVYTPPALDPSATGGVLSFYFPLQYGKFATILPFDLPPRWTRKRDYILASTIDHNVMWADAVSWAISKQVSLDWSVEDTSGSERRTERARSLMLQANMGKGWVNFLTQHLSDYCLCDNGAFVEVIWSTLDIRRGRDGSILPAGRVLGIQHLDSVRCTRTNDIDLYPYREELARFWGIRPDEVHSGNFPVIYMDLSGRFHTLWRWQVLDFVDMPSPRLELRGTGLCAASRAYHAIFKDTNLERYVSEKIVGHSPKEIHLVSGIMQKQFEDATATSLDETRNQNRQVYRGVVVIPGIKPDAAVSGYRIPIAEIPDGFDAVSERSNTYNKYAKALGIPAGDLERAPAGLNSGQTAQVEADQASGTGLAAWRKAWVHAVNQWVLPSSTQFEWSGDDLNDAKLRAEIGKLRAERYKVMIEAGYLTPPQALQMTVDDGDAPAEFMPEDGTPQDTLRDDEKPLEAPESGDAPTNAPAAPIASPEPAQQATEGITLGDVIGRKAESEDLLDATYADAVKWARLAMKDEPRAVDSSRGVATPEREA